MPTNDGSREIPGSRSGSRAVAALLLSAVPPVLVLALAAGYIGIDLVEGLEDPVAGMVPPVVHAGLVALQALALVFRSRFPIVVFALVVLFDAALLATSGGELGTGALAVMIASYGVVRSGSGRTGVVGVSAGRARYVVLLAGAAVTAIVSAVSMIAGATFAPLAILAVVVARPVLQYGIPAGIAEYALARERLVQALRDRAELAERERVRSVEREIAGVRTAMARELHDIAAHHLSGIIVGAQAASALVAVDPERTREMLRTVQRDARTTLADLRRTVGLLRSDDPEDPYGGESAVQPAAIPSLDRIAGLVETARGRGQDVTLVVVGQPRVLGPLAETAGYRMVQESLANAARHAAGAPARVRVEYLSELVRITVDNDASSSSVANAAEPRSAAAKTVQTASRSDRGYGISGMEERAELVGAALTTGPLAGGGWRNRLDIPLDENRTTS